MSVIENPLAALLARNLRAGAILHKFCEFTTPPKNKFMVVGSTHPRLLVLLINSKINDFYYLKGLERFHVPVPVEGHEFLKKESYANCVEAHSAFDYTHVRDEVIANYKEIFKGFLSDDCLEQVYHAVKGNSVIRRGHQKEIVASIEAQLPHLSAAADYPDSIGTN